MELSVKKALIRTISHEIRTPLSTVQLGLKLIHKYATKSGSKMFIETVDGCSISCSAALDLVNEILVHDKLKEGNLVMEKVTTPIWPLIESSVKPFEIQASTSSYFRLLKLFKQR